MFVFLLVRVDRRDPNKDKEALGGCLGESNDDGVAYKKQTVTDEFVTFISLKKAKKQQNGDEIDDFDGENRKFNGH